jgi:peroxiredoxin family protein
MDNMAIIVRDDAYDKVLTPLTFAYLAAASNIEVNMLFVSWAVRYLGKGLETAPCSHPGTDEWMASLVAKAGLPPDPREILKALKATGKVHLYACSLASRIFERGKPDPRSGRNHRRGLVLAGEGERRAHAVFLAPTDCRGPGRDSGSGSSTRGARLNLVDLRRQAVV